MKIIKFVLGLCFSFGIFQSHAHASPLIQYIEAVTPAKTASLTAIAGAMQGTPVFVNASKTPLLKPFIHAIGTILGHAMNLVTGSQYSVSMIDALDTMNPEAIRSFNQKYGSAAIPRNGQSQGQKITANSVHQYSWMGNRQATNPLDVIESTVVTLSGSFLKAEANDGHCLYATGVMFRLSGRIISIITLIK